MAEGPLLMAGQAEGGDRANVSAWEAGGGEQCVGDYRYRLRNATDDM